MTDTVSAAGIDVPGFDVLWRLGDQWRRLDDEIVAAEVVTVISCSGTARIIEADRGEFTRHLRVPPEGGDALHGDHVWRPMAAGAFTPCGSTIVEPGGVTPMGTPLLAVITGSHPNWMAYPGLRDLAEIVISRGTYRYANGHPDEHCGALYCSYPWRDHPTS